MSRFIEVGGKLGFEHTVDTLKPITQSQDFQVRANAVIFQNAGSDIAYINKHWTLYPNSTLSINVPGDSVGIVRARFQVDFAGAVGTTQRLEVMVISVADRELSQYVDKK